MVRPTESDEDSGSCSSSREIAAVMMLHGRNLFVLQAHHCPTEQVQSLTLLVHVREQNLDHFNRRRGTVGEQRVAESRQM
uniref:Uncharacterized protein n=1 Tax=Hyaloperonospora arabidopsidis (strain Emoy2) TaxID=559515 RepID=M4BGP1_HYAAE